MPSLRPHWPSSYLFWYMLVHRCIPLDYSTILDQHFRLDCLSIACWHTTQLCLKKWRQHWTLHNIRIFFWVTNSCVNASMGWYVRKTRNYNVSTVRRRRTLARNLPIGIHKACAHRGWRAEPLNTFHSPAILTFLPHLSVGHSSKTKWLNFQVILKPCKSFVIHTLIFWL